MLILPHRGEFILANAKVIPYQCYPNQVMMLLQDVRNHCAMSFREGRETGAYKDSKLRENIARWPKKAIQNIFASFPVVSSPNIRKTCILLHHHFPTTT